MWRPRASAPRLSAAALLLGALALAGCGSSSPSLVVTAPKLVNGGKPVYMLVRTVPDDTAFTADTYRGVSAKVGAPDETVVMTEVIYPDTQPSFELKNPEKGQLAVYFFFTSPAGEWKMLCDKPLPKSMSIKLGTDRIEQPDSGSK